MALPSCLLVVDVQNGFMSPTTTGLPVAIREFVEANQFEHRIFTRFVNPGAGGPFAEILNWKRLQENMADLSMSHAGTELCEAALRILSKYIDTDNVVNRNELAQR